MIIDCDKAPAFQPRRAGIFSYILAGQSCRIINRIQHCLKRIYYIFRTSVILPLATGQTAAKVFLNRKIKGAEPRPFIRIAVTEFQKGRSPETFKYQICSPPRCLRQAASLRISDYNFFSPAFDKLRLTGIMVGHSTSTF